MKLSIVTPFYNREDHLQKTIESVLASSLDRKDVELILVNDGSTDNSELIAERYNEQNESIIFVNYSENRGVNYARNRGIEKARSDFIAFLDSDDCLVKGGIDRILETITTKDASHFLFLTNVYDRKPQTGKISYQDWVKGKLPSDFLHVVRSKILKKYLFFEQFTAYEELNWYRVIKHTQPLFLDNEKLVEVNRTRNDHLSNKLEVEDAEQLSEKIKTNVTFLRLYSWDLIKYSPQNFFKRIARILLTFAKLNTLKVRTGEANLIHYIYFLFFTPLILLNKLLEKN